MISLETRINGNLIGHAYVENEMCLDTEGNYLYNVRYMRPKGEPPVIEFNVQHKREDGVEILIFLIYEEIGKRLKQLE